MATGRNELCACGSGKKYKRCCLASDRARSASEVAELFFGVGEEPLTDQLIEELVTGGMPRKDLLWAREQGAVYSRPRGSILFPPSGDLGALRGLIGE